MKMRLVLLGVGAALASGCAASLKSMEKSEWVLIQGDDGQEVVPREQHDADISTEGRDRQVKIAVDEKPPMLHEAPAELTATVGEVLRFRVNETGETDLLSDEAVMTVYWDKDRAIDGWKGDQAQEGRESLVFVRATKPGKGKLKLVDKTWGTHEYVLTVKAAEPKK